MLFYFCVLFLICFKNTHLQKKYFLLKTAVKQRQSQKHSLKSLVFLTSQMTFTRLICIFIEPRILNEARVSSYIEDILRLKMNFEN